MTEDNVQLYTRQVRRVNKVIENKRTAACSKANRPGNRAYKGGRATMQENHTPVPPQKQAIGELYLDNRLGFLVPTIFTHHLIIPDRDKMAQFIARIEAFYALYTDEEINQINADQEDWWNELNSDRKPQPKTRIKKTGYVYLLKSDTGHYKIGRTIDPSSRSKTFGIQLPFDVTFICTIKTDNMYGLESELHQKFSKKRINGEWFNLSTEDIDYMKSLAVQA